MKKYILNLIFIISGLILFIILINLVFLDIKTYEYEATIGNNVGINVDNDKIYFGTILKNGVSKRNIRIEGIQSKSIVKLKANGDLSESIYFSENNFIIDKDQVKEIEIILAPQNVEYGKYQGKVILFFLRKW